MTDQPPRRQEGLLGRLHGVHGDAGRDLPEERYLGLVGLRQEWGTGGLCDRARLSGLMSAVRTAGLRLVRDDAETDATLAERDDGPVPDTRATTSS